MTRVWEFIYWRAGDYSRATPSVWDKIEGWLMGHSTSYREWSRWFNAVGAWKQ